MPGYANLRSGCRRSTRRLSNGPLPERPGGHLQIPLPDEQADLNRCGINRDYDEQVGCVILIPDDSFVGPPMEEGVGLDNVVLLDEGAASVCEGLAELFEAVEGPVGDRFIGQRPEPLGWLELRGIGRQEAERDAVGRLELVADMPAGIIDHEHDRGAPASTDGFCEGIENALEERHVDAAGEPPFDGTGGWPYEAIEVEPLVLVMADREGALAPLRPDPAADRLQAEAMLVEGPDLDRPAGRPAPCRRYRAAEFFLNRPCVAASAALACRGRGR